MYSLIVDLDRMTTSSYPRLTKTSPAPVDESTNSSNHAQSAWGPPSQMNRRASVSGQATHASQAVKPVSLAEPGSAVLYETLARNACSRRKHLQEALV